MIRERSTGKPWVIYTRVSTHEQAEDGISLDVQEASCRAFLAIRKQPVGRVLRDDGFSAATTKRPAYRQLVEMIRGGELGGLVINKLNRIHRNQIELLLMVRNLQAVGAGFVSVTEAFDINTPHGILMLQQLGSFAEYFRNDKSDEVKRAMSYLKAKGCWLGSPPTGFVVEKREKRTYLAPHPVHGAAVGECWRLVAGGATIAQVAQHLNAAGVPTRKKKPWARSSVSYLLTTKHAIGLLVDEATWKRARAILDTRPSPKSRMLKRAKASSSAPRPSDRVWRLHGMANCAKCGSALVGISATGRSGKYPYLRCSGRNQRGKKFCDAKDLPAVEWENAVIERLSQLLTGDELNQTLAEQVAKHQAESAPARARLEKITAERDALKVQLDRALDVMVDGGAVARAMSGRVSELQERLEAINVERAEVVAEVSVSQIDQSTMEMVSIAIRANIARLVGAAPEEQLHLLKLIVQRVTLGSGFAGEISLWPHPGLIEQAKDAASVPGVALVRSNSTEWLSLWDKKRTMGIRLPFLVIESRGRRGKHAIRVSPIGQGLHYRFFPVLPAQYGDRHANPISPGPRHLDSGSPDRDGDHE